MLMFTFLALFFTILWFGENISGFLMGGGGGVSHSETYSENACLCIIALPNPKDAC